MTTRNPHQEDRFAAALAHQIKTPLSVLKNTATNLRRNLRALVEELEILARPAEPATETCRLISRALSLPPSPPPTGLLPRDRVEVMARRLREKGIDGEVDAAASSLIRGGWDTCIDEITPLLQADPEAALAALETIARLRNNLAGIESSIERIGKLSVALRLLGCPSIETTTDLRRGLEACLVLVRSSAPAGVSVSLVGDESGPLHVVGQDELLQQVWTNLITNAVQAVGERGSVTIETRAEGSGRSRAVHVRITDDGPGIPEDVRARLFEPFFTTRAAQGGEGLGLALVRSIVTKCGGEIAVSSRPGRTWFEVSLRAAMAAAAAGRRA
ncbi:MAG: ATP-binding protein [Acidobacteriota bacterium]